MMQVMSTAIRFTVAEYDRMIEEGVFEDWRDVRLELIYGEIREKMTINPPHEDAVDLLNYWSVDNAPRDQVRVRIRQSLGIPALDSVPEPDVAWMRAGSYHRRRPEPEDVLLLIEVAESSLSDDRGEKADLYAQAGVHDYWIVNVIDLCIEVHRQPRDGKFRERKSYGIGDTISPLAFPSITLEVSRVFSR
jgi:Uma2 family endonuclease